VHIDAFRRFLAGDLDRFGGDIATGDKDRTR
jgi:hypothetical protein